MGVVRYSAGASVRWAGVWAGVHCDHLFPDGFQVVVNFRMDPELGDYQVSGEVVVSGFVGLLMEVGACVLVAGCAVKDARFRVVGCD